MDDGLEFVQLIADPNRWRILHALARSDLRVSELTAALDQPQNLVSYHLRTLRDAGLVAKKRSAADARDTYYRLESQRYAQLWSAAGAGLRVEPGGALPRGKRVLFLCTGNSARSQMAEAMLRDRTGGRVEARSAGSHPKALHPNAVAAMAARSIDISAAKPKALQRFARSRFDHVITLCDKVREVCPELPGTPTTSHWSVADPALEGAYAAFETTADELDRRLGVFVAQLANDSEVKTHG